VDISFSSDSWKCDTSLYYSLIDSYYNVHFVYFLFILVFSNLFSLIEHY